LYAEFNPLNGTLNITFNNIVTKRKWGTLTEDTTDRPVAWEWLMIKKVTLFGSPNADSIRKSVATNKNITGTGQEIVV